MEKETRAVILRRAIADVAMEAAHITYNAQRGKRIIETCIKILQERIDEIQPKKATLAYKKARYGKK